VRILQLPIKRQKKLDYLKETEILKSELLKIHTQFESTKFIFVDDTLNDTLVKIKNLKLTFDALPFHLTFSSYMRLDLLHRFNEQINLLSGHVEDVFFGIETMNKEYGKIVGKSLDWNKQIETAWEVKNKWKCNLTASFIVGLPNASAAEFDNLQRFLLSNENPFDGWHLSPLSLSNNTDREWQSKFQKKSKIIWV
jgi:radical SAM superfamily enzyme YgiQ (UPF0313 family)